MNSRIEMAIAAIVRLREEFSWTELQMAFSTLQKAKPRDIPEAKTGKLEGKTLGPRGKRKPVEQAMALTRLEKIDPARFAYLVALERKLRGKELLPNNSELLRFCRAFDKDFAPRKRRDDTVSALMKVLTNLPLSELESRLPQALESAPAGDIDAYHLLARELIGGKSRGGN